MPSGPNTQAKRLGKFIIQTERATIKTPEIDEVSRCLDALEKALTAKFLVTHGIGEMSAKQIKASLYIKARKARYNAIMRIKTMVDIELGELAKTFTGVDASKNVVYNNARDRRESEQTYDQDQEKDQEKI
jgi:hypothetical protein